MHQIDAVENWLNSVALSHSGAEATTNLYKRGIAYFLEFLGADVDEISREYHDLPERDFKHKYGQLLQAWAVKMRKQGLSPGSVGSYMIAVKSFFKYNDYPLSFMPVIKRKVTFHNRDIAKEEIVHILSVSSPRERAFYAVMAQSGLRPNTLCALRMKHLEPDYSENRVPLKISVPEELTKGEYHGYFSFIAEDAARLLRDYLKTRPNLDRESYVFTNQGSDLPMIRNTISSLFRKTVRMLRDKHLMEYEQKQTHRPAEIRLYSLRKWFRKQAIQAGFENVEFWMGHSGPGVDSAYRPKDEEFYRKIYAEKAAPFLRLESAAPNETEKLIANMQAQHEKELNDLKAWYEARMTALEKEYQNRDNIIKKLAEKIEKWEKEQKTEA